jgi:hypothetical protein
LGAQSVSVQFVQKHHQTGEVTREALEHEVHDLVAQKDAARIGLEKLPSLPEGHPDRAFYEGKKWAALYFCRNVLPSVEATAKVLEAGDSSAIDIPDAAFATV